ncbi:MAG TPA: hypothetical protein VKZ88_02970 [Fibrobacteria bacterium]|nr:hypothetical protein [Fibrobacteria bacterium]
MGSGAWKGAGLGAILFLVIAAVGALTPLRVPLLKIAGRDYPALQLQKEAAQAAVSSRAPVSGPDALTRERVDVRLEAWHKRNATLSVFGLLGWLMEMWPWLLGLGVALPLLGGLIGAQDERRNPGHEGRGRRDTPSGSPRAAGPVVDSPVARPPAAVPTEPEPPAASVVEPPPAATPVVPAAPAPPSAPLPPSEWSWNARPVPRRAPGRPKPPPVESPNSDAV